MSALTDGVAALMAKGEEISARWEQAYAASRAVGRHHSRAGEHLGEATECWRRDRTETNWQARGAAAQSCDARSAEWTAALADLEAVTAELRANSRSIRDLLNG